jgi:Leucine-rich repeat (LRR) protein
MISGNRLGAIPSEFGNLKNLRELVLDANQLATLPESLAECENLKTISIIENPMEEGVPRVLLDKKGLSIDQ